MPQFPVGTLKLLAEVDEAAVQRSIKRLNELRQSSLSVAESEKKMGQSSKDVTAGLGPLNSNTQKRIDLLRKEIQLAEKQAIAEAKLAQSIEKEATAKNKANAASSKSGRQQLTALAGGTSALGGLESLAGAGPGGDILRAVSAIARLKTQIDQFTEASEGAAEAGGKAATGLSGIGGSLAGLAAAGVAAIALAAMSIAIAKFVEDLNRYQHQLSVAADAQVKYYELIQSGTAEEIQAELKRIEVKRNAIEWARRDAEAGRLATEAWSGFSGAIARLLGILGVTTKKEKEYADQLAELNAQVGAYNKALGSQEIEQRSQKTAIENVTAAEQKRNAALDEAKRKEEERTKAIQQAAQDIAQARMREVQAEAEASQKRAQKMQDISRQFAQASADALRKLQSEQQELVIQLGQEQADIITESQREEVRASREHARKIVDIREKAAREEFDASLSLDFARIAAIRRNAEAEIDDESEQFQAEREEANEALRERLGDALKAFQREREARLRDYAVQMADLRISRQRQQQEARIAYQREIELLRQHLTNEIKLKQQALQAVLDATRNWASLMSAAVGRRTTSTSDGITSRAAGGPLAIGQTSFVNEVGNERFMSGGRSYVLPHGLGVFTPMKGGTVENNRNMGGVAIHIHESRNPRQTQAMIERAIKGLVS
jgi:hypothetical protein